MSNSTKTLGKRKSFNKSSENISKAKMLSKSSISKIIDKSAKTPGTPGQTKFVPKISSEQKQNSNKANKKRKSLPANLINGSDDITSKKSKLEPFSGTSDLFMQMKESENESKDTDEKSDVKDNKDTKSNRKQRKDNARTLRVAAKERFKKTIADAASGNDEAVTFVKSKIEELETKTQLTNSCKRKLKLLRRVLKNSGISLPNFSKTEKQDSNVAKQNNLGQNNKNKNKTKKTKLSKLQTKTKKDPAIDSEEESENDEDEEDGSSDNQVSKLIEKESTEEEEDEIDEEDTDDDEEEDDKDDEGEEEEDDDSDEKEEDESGSDENEIPSTNTPAPKKKNQPQISRKEDSAEINSSPRSKSQLTLFVGNIPYDVTQEDIAEHFSKAGNVKDIRIPLDKKTNKSRGFAYVELANNPSYQKALTLNQTTLKGRRINVKDSESGNKKGKNMKSPAMKQGGKPFGNFKGPHKGFAGRQKRQSK